MLVVRSTKVEVTHVDASSKLQLVVRAGAGTDTIDVKYCAKQGIYVANCPGKNAHAVAELTIGMMISIDRRMAEGNQTATTPTARRKKNHRTQVTTVTTQQE